MADVPDSNSGDYCGAVQRRGFRVAGVVPAVMDVSLSWLLTSRFGPRLPIWRASKERDLGRLGRLPAVVTAARDY